MGDSGRFETAIEFFEVSTKQLKNLPKYHAMIKLPGHESHYVSIFPPREMTTGSLEAVKANTRARYSKPIKARKPPTPEPKW